MKNMSKKLIWGAALALIVAGCATEVGTFTRIGRVCPPKPESAHIEIYTNGLPEKAFEKIAILDVQCESQGFMTPNLENDGLPVLIKKARQAGCDAIIEIKELKPQANWTFETKVKQYTATGIVFK